MLKSRIFNNVTNLCFWLGKDPDMKLGLQCIPNIIDFSKGVNTYTNSNEIDKWLDFVRLLKHPAFGRLWLVHELALARNATIHIDTDAIHYSDFVDAMSLFMSNHTEMSLLFRRNNMNYRQLNGREIKRAQHFVDVTRDALRVDDSGQFHYKMTIEYLVSLLSDYSCSHPCDRIFAMVAISRDAQPNCDRYYKLHPNYTKSTIAVCQDFVAHCIETSRSLDILCRPWAASIAEGGLKLPTWICPVRSPIQKVFDTSPERTSAESFVGLPGNKVYNASKGAHINFRIVSRPSSQDAKSLLVTGFLIDTIATLAPRAEDSGISPEWLQLGGCDVDNGIIWDEFSRVLVANRGPNGSAVPRWYDRAFVYCLQFRVNGTISPSKITAKSSHVIDFLQRVEPIIWNRKLFVSRDRELIGLAPTACEVGDIICVLHGCSVPVVLRPSWDAHGESYNLLVGECYVHGMMDGEAVEMQKEEDIEVCEIEIR